MFFWEGSNVFCLMKPKMFVFRCVRRFAPLVFFREEANPIN